VKLKCFLATSSLYLKNKMNKFFLTLLFVGFVTGRSADRKAYIKDFPNPIKEGTQYSLKLDTSSFSSDWVKACKITVSVAGNEVVVSPLYFRIEDVKSTIDINIQVKDDNSCETRTLAYLMECFDEETSDFSRSLVAIDRYNVPVLNTTPLKLCKDPRYHQTIMGQDEDGTDTQIQICYDVEGPPGDIIEFVGDSMLGLEILIQFGGNSAIEKVFVRSLQGTATISLKYGLEQGSGFTVPWGKLGKLLFDIDSPVLSIEGLGDYFVITSQMEGRMFSIKVFRVHNGDRQESLSVVVDNVGNGRRNLDENHTGLLGYIGNKEFIVVSQSNKYGGTQTMVVSNRVMKTFRKSENSCYSVNLEEVLYPRVLSRFKQKYYN